MRNTTAIATLVERATGIDIRATLKRMGAACTHVGYDGVVSKVIQIRDVPDEVRDALAEAAKAEGLSLAGYVRRELVQVAGRAQRVRDNAAVVRQTQHRVGRGVDRETILSALHEGRRG